MSVKIKSCSGNQLKLEVSVDLSGSMLEAEEKIQAICNKLGSVSTEKALERFDTDGTPIVIGEKKYTAKKKANKHYQTPYGAVQVSRYVYQPRFLS